MTTSKGLLTFKSFSDTPFARSNSVIISQLIDEIDELIHKGCSRELIYKSLTSEPYNLVVTYQSFVTLLSRARAKKRKTRLAVMGVNIRIHVQ